MCKRICMILFMLFVFAGCTMQGVGVENVNSIDDGIASYYNAYELIDRDKVLTTVSIADMQGNVNDALNNFEYADHVVIGRVLSIDGGSNVNEYTGGYTYPYTYGTVEVLKEYKGSFEDNLISYVRVGGIISYEDYYSSLSVAQKEKRNYLGNEPEYVERYFEDDIKIEPGKVYLMYLNESASKENHYAIVFLQGGLREIDETSVVDSADSQLRVYNNCEQKWEKLEDVLPNIDK